MKEGNFIVYKSNKNINKIIKDQKFQSWYCNNWKELKLENG